MQGYLEMREAPPGSAASLSPRSIIGKSEWIKCYAVIDRVEAARPELRFRREQKEQWHALLHTKGRSSTAPAAMLLGSAPRRRRYICRLFVCKRAFIGHPDSSVERSAWLGRNPQPRKVWTSCDEGDVWRRSSLRGQGRRRSRLPRPCQASAAADPPDAARADAGGRAALFNIPREGRRADLRSA